MKVLITYNYGPDDPEWRVMALEVCHYEAPWNIFYFNFIMYDAWIGKVEVNTDANRLKEVYPNLKAHYEWCKRNWQKPNSLYFGDAFGMHSQIIPCRHDASVFCFAWIP